MSCVCLVGPVWAPYFDTYLYGYRMPLFYIDINYMDDSHVSYTGAASSMMLREISFP